ncbi:hypothetical protein GCM10010277_84870 [Streptomyces longisporoflavus]|nr:hypothetical protein GCM10010277_84870 [Streptomyces longisporoflavus]
MHCTRHSRQPLTPTPQPADQLADNGDPDAEARARRPPPTRNTKTPPDPRSRHADRTRPPPTTNGRASRGIRGDVRAPNTTPYAH